MDINVRKDAIKPGNIVAEYEMGVKGGAGGRNAFVWGCGKTEVGGRQQLVEQMKALRDELNVAIEDAVYELATGRF
jgi:hypothetical protein